MNNTTRLEAMMKRMDEMPPGSVYYTFASCDFVGKLLREAVLEGKDVRYKDPFFIVDDLYIEVDHTLPRNTFKIELDQAVYRKK